MREFIDTSVFCGPWPFRYLSPRTPRGLKRHLARHGVTQAWVAATEAVLCPDPMQANVPLLKAVAGDPFFVPVAIIDVTLGTWRRDLEACLGRWGCRAVKLVPNYQRYALSDPRVGELVVRCVEAGAPICVQMRMMDERSHHPLMVVPGVEPAKIAELAAAHPGARVLACGAYRMDLKALSAAPNVRAETSLIDSQLALRTAVQGMGFERVVFGSHSPFQYFAAMAAKLEVAPCDVPPEQLDAIRSGNAARLLSG